MLRSHTRLPSMWASHCEVAHRAAFFLAGHRPRERRDECTLRWHSISVTLAFSPAPAEPRRRGSADDAFDSETHLPRATLTQGARATTAAQIADLKGESGLPVRTARVRVASADDALHVAGYPLWVRSRHRPSPSQCPL